MVDGEETPVTHGVSSAVAYWACLWTVLSTRAATRPVLSARLLPAGSSTQTSNHVVRSSTRSGDKLAARETGGTYVWSPSARGIIEAWLKSWRIWR